MTYRDAEGAEYGVGDCLMFKNGVEQYGRFVRMEGNFAILSCWDSDIGERYEQSVSANRVYLDN